MIFNASTLNRGSVIKGDSIIYHITDVLGQGSFGITYKATIKTLAKGAFGEDWVDTNTPKAIKEFFMSDINSRDDVTGNVQGFVPGGISTYYAQKFYKEARNLAKMKHPNIVKVTDFIEANNTYYYAMDYIEGDNLNHYIEQHKLSEEEAVSIINDVAGALQYMHEEHKMLHLDMKPGNVMRSKDGHIYVIDFGLSKHFNEQGEPDTSTTVGFGTEGYAPLEQGKKTQKSNDFSPTIDVYALGGTFFKLLTGKTPPSSADVLEDDTLLGSIMERHQVCPGLQKIIISAMAPSSKRRMQSVKEFRNALNDYLGETKPFENPDEKEKTAVVEMPTEKTQVVASVQPSEQTTPVGESPIKTNHVTIHNWEYVGDYHEGLAPVKDANGKWGYIDKTGRVVIPCEWKDAWFFSEGLAAVQDANGKWGLIDKTGKLVIPCEWKDAWPFSEGLAAVQDNNLKYGFIDQTGRLVIPCTWENAGDFHEGLANVQDANDKYGFIDKTGKLVIPCQWEYAYSFSEGLADVKDANWKWGFIDKTGKLVIPCKWIGAGLFSEGLAAVRDANGKYGFINKMGKVIIPCQWKDAGAFSEGLANVRDANGKWFKIDKTGKVVNQVVTSAQPSEKTTPVVSPVSQTSPIQPPKRKKSLIYIILALVIAVVTGGVIALVATNSSKWESISDYSEGLAAVMDSNGKWGFIDKTGQVVIPGQWDVVGSFSEGLAPVKDDNDKYGYIDKTGRLVIPYKWNGAEFFREGLAKVQDANWKYGFIDKTGKLVIPCKWNWAGDFYKGLAEVQDDNDKWFKIDKTGKVVK